MTYNISSFNYSDLSQPEPEPEFFVMAEYQCTDPECAVLETFFDRSRHECWACGTVMKLAGPNMRR